MNRDIQGNTSGNDIISNLVNKSIEAFILAIEVYNKPTIRYRVEGFSFFICNAWELILKAELLKRGKDIYYKNNRNRTITLHKAISKVYSDKRTRVRLNLEKILKLRNISTHYINEDYEAKYIPLFQACVLNFINAIKKYHNVDITEHIGSNFLTLSTRYEPLTNEQIRLKYSPEVALKLIESANDIDVSTKELNSDKFSINIKQHLYITKSKESADFEVRINKNAKEQVAIVKEQKDPSETHKYSFDNVIYFVQQRLERLNIQLEYEKGFNKYVLNLVNIFYDAKQTPEYSYCHRIGNSESYTYSQVYIDFIVEEIQKNPKSFVDSLKK